MLKRVCKKHATWIGCAVAVVTFLALHVAVPALVATGVAGHAHAKSEQVRPHVLLGVGSVTVYQLNLNIPGEDHKSVCVVAVAEGRMAVTVDVECVR
jgi:hypothetical protein